MSFWNSLGKAVEAAAAGATAGAPGLARQSSTPGWDSLRSAANSALDPAAAAALPPWMRQVGAAAVNAVERKVKQAHMAPAAESDLTLALHAARLADAAYEPDEAALQHLLGELPGSLELLHFSA